jgi:inhibitor of KinA sporulation pathway (predicted exonuclease)
MARLNLDWNAALFPSTRHMVLMDLEATAGGDDPAPSDPVITDDNCEIIEIGLTVIDLEGERAKPTAEFSSVVRPALNPTLTQFCSNYTGIRQAEVDRAPVYPEVSAALTDFVAQLDMLPGGWSWGSWGVSDLELLEREATRNGCSNPLPADRHFDLKATFQAMRGEKGGTGQKDALDRLGVAPLAKAHRAPGDALNLSALFWVMRRYAVAQAVATERWGLDRAREWMRENSSELDGRRPAILMHNDDELAQVLAVIEPAPAMEYAP